MLILDPTIGSDCELFLKEKATGAIVSAEPYIKGTKDFPYQFDPETSKWFATSLDNVMAEYCIPPTTSKEEFYNNHKRAIDYINSILPPEFQTIATPAANLDPIYLQTEQAQKFGCLPDYCAYTEQENLRPEPEDATLRSAGGHIHVGYKNWCDATNIKLVKALDLFVGVPSVLQEPENKRKELYGKAGAFRHKEYGVEYRTISNYYLESKRLTYWLFDAVGRAIDFVNRNDKIEQYLGGVIQNAINNNNKETAAELIKDFNIKLAA